jgi:hypothetical protein
VIFGIGSFGVREDFSECGRREEIVHEFFGAPFAVPLYIGELVLDMDEKQLACRLNVGVVETS